MKTKKKENLKNDQLNPQAEVLVDLIVDDEQAGQAKGGPTLNFEKFETTFIESNIEGRV